MAGQAIIETKDLSKAYNHHKAVDQRRGEDYDPPYVDGFDAAHGGFCAGVRVGPGSAG